jgi:hypothetical protein
MISDSFRAFLKPTKTKIIVVLLFITLYIQMIYYTAINPVTNLILLPILLPNLVVMILFSMFIRGWQTHQDMLLLLGVLPDLLYWYFLACLIVFVLNKLKPKRNKVSHS